MLFNGGIVPTYLLITKYLQLKNTYCVHLASVASAWNLIVLRTNFPAPDALVESAKIDGASEYRICFSINAAAERTRGGHHWFHFVGKWNDWTTCVYYSQQALSHSLQYFAAAHSAGGGVHKAAFRRATALEAGAQIPTESFRFAMAVLAAARCW